MNAARRLALCLAILAIAVLSLGATLSPPRGPAGPVGPSGFATGRTYYFETTASDAVTPGVGPSATIAFHNNGGAADTITSTVHDFVALGFRANQQILVTLAAEAANNATWTIDTVAVSTITLIHANTLTDEIEGASANVTIASYNETILAIPSTAAQVDESVSVISTDTNGATIDTYATMAGLPAITVIPAGLIEFHSWFYVSSSAGLTTAHYEMLKRSAAGVETVLFTTGETADINETTLATSVIYSTYYANPSDVVVLVDDRIMVRIIFRTSSTAKTAHFVYMGTTRASHIHTTISSVATASALYTTTGSVNVAGSAAPALGDVLVATDATHATWQAAPGGGAAPVSLAVSGAPLSPLAAGATTACTSTAGWFDAGTLGEFAMTSTASASVTIKLYRTDACAAGDLVYWVDQADGMAATFRDLIGTYYRDEDTTTELHWVATNHGAAATTVAFTVYGVGQ